MSAKDLRLALCLRGGVSLAVWMGGACREIAALRTAKTYPPAPEPFVEADIVQVKIYHDLLRLAGYRMVTVDVIAGTSAGGLNGALFANHLMYGMRFESGVRDTWLRVGDLESLTRDPGVGYPPSLLEGDNGFYARLRAQMRGLLEDSEAWPPSTKNSPRLVRLILTATRLVPRGDYIRPSIGSPMFASRSQAHLRFRHRRLASGDVETEFTDFGEGADSPSLDRLAYAARTTSSFPVAFEPARPNVVRPPGEGVEPGHDMFGISSETGVPDGDGQAHVQLMDGGVLDNVPLSWAIRAVAGAPAGTAVDRWLLYLQPVPPKPPNPQQQGGSLIRLARAVQALVNAKVNSESLLDDADELREAWTSAQRLQGAAGGLPGNPDLEELPDLRHLLEGYGAALACVEADRLARLVEDPVQVLGPDPLPIPHSRPLDGDKRWRDFLEELHGEAKPRIVLDPDAGGGVAAFRSLLAPARAVTLALDWMHATENKLSTPTKSQACALRKAREALYGVRFACEVLLAARDRLLLRGLVPEGDVENWVRIAGRQLDLLIVRHGGLHIRARWQPVLAAVSRDCIDGDDLPDPGLEWADPFMAPLWQRIARICRGFVRSMKDAADVVGFRALRQAAPKGIQDMVEVLAAAELVLGPLRPDPFSEPTRIRFHTVSATAVSPLEKRLIRTGRPDSDATRVARKLSGNQLLNFASFLSSRWRLNDWTWGRLDAATSLVDVVARAERLKTTGKKDLLEWLRTLHGELRARDEELGGLIGPWERWNVHEANVHERLPIVITTWLHWNILRQEIPLLAGLTEEGIDVPPSETQLAKADVSTDGPLGDRMKILGEVGAETVRDLLRKPHLRRAGFRLGLVAWRAIQPAGKGMASVVHSVFGVLKPLVLPPLLIGFLAPIASLIAAVLGWGAVSLATNQWFSPPAHLFVSLGAAVAVASSCWHFELAPKVWQGIVLVAVVFGALSAGGWVLFEGQELPWRLGPTIRAVAVGVLVAVAVFASLWGVAATGIRAGLVGRLGFVSVTSVMPGLVATTALLLIGVRNQELLINGWGATGILYATLFLETFYLTYFFPSAPEPD